MRTWRMHNLQVMYMHILGYIAVPYKETKGFENRCAFVPTTHAGTARRCVILFVPPTPEAEER